MAKKVLLSVILVCIYTIVVLNKLTDDIWEVTLKRFRWTSPTPSQQTQSSSHAVDVQHTGIQKMLDLILSPGRKYEATMPAMTHRKQTVEPTVLQVKGTSKAYTTFSEEGEHLRQTQPANQRNENGNNGKDQKDQIQDIRRREYTVPQTPTTPNANKDKMRLSNDKPSSCKAQFINFTEEEDWGSFRKAGPKTYVYSAYYDARPEAKIPSVKIIAMSSVNVSIYCHLWYGNKEYSKVSNVPATVTVPIGKKGAILETVVFLCPTNLSDSNAGIPQVVVFSESPCGPPRAVLPVSNLHARSLQYNFTVCLHKAFIQEYNNSAQFVEWVEVNRIFGAEHFLVYNFSSGINLLPYIQYYIREGVMEYRNWHVKPFERLIKNWKGQNGVMFDCAYRYMFRTKYMVMTDVDEIVVPRKHDTWNELLENNLCGKSTAVNIMQVLFSLLYEVHPSYANNKTMSRLHLNTLKHTLRKNFTWPCGIRSKLIIQPDHALNPGCHMSMMSDECCMPEDYAQLFHYRWFNDTIYDTWKSKDYYQRYTPYYKEFDNMVNETRMYHFHDKIVQNVAKVYEAVRGGVAGVQ